MALKAIKQVPELHNDSEMLDTSDWFRPAGIQRAPKALNTQIFMLLSRLQRLCEMLSNRIPQQMPLRLGLEEAKGEL